MDKCIGMFHSLCDSLWKDIGISSRQNLWKNWYPLGWLKEWAGWAYHTQCQGNKAKFSMHEGT